MNHSMFAQLPVDPMKVPESSDDWFLDTIIQAQKLFMTFLNSVYLATYP